MTNNPNPQQNKPSSSSTSFGQQGSSGRTEGNAGNRQDMGRSQGSETQQFGGIRGGVESEKSSSRSSSSSSPDVERYLGAIEENCRKLRDALSASGSSSASMSRSESSESSRSGSSIGSNPSSGNQAGRASR